METAYFNGKYLPREEIRISPDDRGFYFADGVYEVARWYESFFYDMEGHLRRLKRSLSELTVDWPEADSFPGIAHDLISKNGLTGKPAMVYLQVTRGVAKRTHQYPDPQPSPTSYAYAWGFIPDVTSKRKGIRVMLTPDIRWSRCDIKSISLLANTMSFTGAHKKGFKECIFVRDGIITEGSRSNIFFVRNGTLYTHPVSNNILNGITRLNILRLAREAGMSVREEAVSEKDLGSVSEAFIANTSSEVTPVTEIGGFVPGNGKPGPLTVKLQEMFDAEIERMRR